jgi:hypothetical protein
MVVFYLGLQLVSREELDGGGGGGYRASGRRARPGRVKLRRGSTAPASASEGERERARSERESSGRERERARAAYL